MRRELNRVEVVRGRSRERCSTSVEAVSGYVLTVISVVPTAAVTLVSCYLATLGGETAVSHMSLVPGRHPGFSQRLLSEMTGQTHARACLLDHAAELQATLPAGADADVRVDISESALEAAAAVWQLAAEDHD